jgi:predicted nucleic acid-binding protein
MAEQVIDASVAVKWVVKGEPFRRQAQHLLRDAGLNDIQLIGPPLLEYEIESILQLQLHSGRATATMVDNSLNAFYATGIQIITHPQMVQRARTIARRFQQDRIYDSLYCALADLRACPFWTADKRFYDAVRRKLPFVKYLANYR